MPLPTNKQTVDYNKIQLLGTLSFESHRANSKIDLVDPHWSENGENAPSSTAQWCELPQFCLLYITGPKINAFHQICILLQSICQ